MVNWYKLESVSFTVLIRCLVNKRDHLPANRPDASCQYSRLNALTNKQPELEICKYMLRYAK